MQINRITAKKIVTELEEIIHQKINMMDENGVIIASTDKSRIGLVHAGAKEVLDKKLGILVIESDDEFPGSRAGINLPIEMNGKYTGVVGITGHYENIEKYGRIIRKMTEILLLEDMLKEEKQRVRNATERFLNDWVFEAGAGAEAVFTHRDEELGINMNLPRRLVILSESEKTEKTANAGRFLVGAEHLLQRMADAEKDSYLCIKGQEIILLLKERSDEEIRSYVGTMTELIRREYGVLLDAGADSEPFSGEGVHESLLRARKALLAAHEHRESGIFRQKIVFYREIIAELFVPEVPDQVKEEYLNRLFRGLTREERMEYMHILRVLLEFDGSINKTSEHLFIHKNTLQYKLNRLAERTGTNPRKLEGAALYYLALKFHDSLQ